MGLTLIHLSVMMQLYKKIEVAHFKSILPNVSGTEAGRRKGKAPKEENA